MDNYSKDVLSEIQERAFSEGYNQALIEKMYAEEGAKEKEAILDRLKRYGGKVKDLAWGDKWEGNKLRRGVTIGTAAGLGTLAYLKHKKAKAEEAAEALEEAAEAQREYSAYLANLEERIYSEDEDALEEAADKKRLAIAGAIGAGSVAGIGGGIAGASALRKRNYEKARQALTDAVNKSIIGAEGADKLKAEAEKKLNKYGIDYLTDSNLLERGKDYWKKSSKKGKAGIIGAGAAGLALGAGAGVGAKKAYDYYKNKKNND